MQSGERVSRARQYEFCLNRLRSPVTGNLVFPFPVQSDLVFLLRGQYEHSVDLFFVDDRPSCV